ncbi:MAG: response regulator [Sulfitobacter sp.]
MPRPNALPTSDPSDSARNLSVLVLDDERFDRHRLARLCSGLDVGCDVTNAITLVEFEAQLDAGRYDLIMVDYLLPDGTGLQALDAVRRSARNFASATIMITGQFDDAVATQALRGGCADYLTKDELTKETFQRAVTNALEKSALTMAVQAQTFARAEVEAVLELFASRFAGDIKPMVSRTLRQLRDHRRAPDTDGIAAIETSCMAMWETLVELERQPGVEMMADTMQGSVQPPIKEGQRKPPSPFARVRN